MQRQVITAETIRLVRASGQTELAFAQGDIVTQQARDDARRYGIRLVMGGSSTSSAPDPAALPGYHARLLGMPETNAVPPMVVAPAQAMPVSGQTFAPSAPGTLPGPEQVASADMDALRLLLAGLRNGTPAAVPASEPMAEQPARHDAALSVNAPMNRDRNMNTTTPPLGAVEEAFIEQVRAQVRTLLPAGLRVDDSCIAEAIRRVLGKAGSGGRPQEVRPGVYRAHGVSHVDSCAQSRGGNRTGEGMTVMEVLSPALGDAVTVGYLEWENDTMPWTFRRPEALVVLEGAVALSIEGTTFSAAAGDVFGLPAGSEVELHASNRVKCVTVACQPTSGRVSGEKA